MSTKQTPLSAFKKQVTFKNNKNISSRQNDKTRKKEVTTMVNKSSEMSGSSQVPKTKSSDCLLYTSPSPRDATLSRMPSSA